jgi:YfiH family protein
LNQRYRILGSLKPLAMISQHTPRGPELYHWAMDQPDNLTRIADDRVLDFSAGGVRMLFAFGPPRPAGPPEDRMRRLMADPGTRVGAVRWGEQVHGRVIASLAAEHGRPFENAACVGRCDALVTADAGVGLVVWTADCVPILIYGDGVVAAVHSGWRGSVADITGAVVRRFAVEYGIPPQNLRAMFGPAISGPQYEVSREVIDGLREFGLDEARWRKENQVDLRGFLAARLEDLGLDSTMIDVAGPCTALTPELASYRRDGVGAGRQ